MQHEKFNLCVPMYVSVFVCERVPWILSHTCVCKFVCVCVCLFWLDCRSCSCVWLMLLLLLLLTATPADLHPTALHRTATRLSVGLSLLCRPCQNNCHSFPACLRLSSLGIPLSLSLRVSLCMPSQLWPVTCVKSPLQGKREEGRGE